MTNKNLAARIRRLCSQYAYSMQWQAVTFGYNRAVIACDNLDDFQIVLHQVQRLKGAHVETWTAYDGVFEGYVYIMDADDHIAWQAANAEQMARVEAWWQRYHDADEETRRLMACGAID